MELTRHLLLLDFSYFSEYDISGSSIQGVLKWKSRIVAKKKVWLLPLNGEVQEKTKLINF